MQLVKFITIAAFFGFAGCGFGNSVKHYQYLGEIGFRRSLAGHEHWSEDYLDSVLRSNPTTMYVIDSKEQRLLDILTEAGFISRNELLLDSIATNNMMVFKETNTSVDSIFLKQNPKKMTAYMLVRNGRVVDSIPLDKNAFFIDLSLLPAKNNEPYIFLLNQYYIINGDNFEISIYEKK